MKWKSVTPLQPMREGLPIRLVRADDLFDRMRDTYGSIARRAFEIFECSGQPFGHDLDDWFRAESELLHPVHLDVAESGNALTVRAEVPGFSAKEIEVSVEPRRLTISGKRETKEERKTEKTIYSERCADQILRVLDLPAEIDTGKVEATLRDGILELAMPKAAEAKKIRVEPKVA
jgi:HSP20 family protein